MSKDSDIKSRIDDVFRSEELLADFVEGRLDAASSEQVQVWLAENERAFDAVVLARSLIEEERALAGAPFPVTNAQRAGRDGAKALFKAPGGLRAVFRLLGDALDLIESFGGDWAPVPAPAVRGGGEGPCDRDLWAGAVRAEDLTLRVEVERTEGGAVIAAGVDRPEGAQVALLRDDGIVSLCPATKEPAELAEVGEGAYFVEVRRGGEALGRVAVGLEASG